MGYTVYWSQSRSFTPAEWARIMHEAKRIVTMARKMNIRLEGNSEVDQPIIDDRMIMLNGAGKEGCETFALKRAKQRNWRSNDANAPYRDFCKTHRLPYNAVVLSILHVVGTIAPDVLAVSTDDGVEVIQPVIDNMWLTHKETEGYKAMIGTKPRFKLIATNTIGGQVELTDLERVCIVYDGIDIPEDAPGSLQITADNAEVVVGLYAMRDEGNDVHYLAAEAKLIPTIVSQLLKD